MSLPVLYAGYTQSKVDAVKELIESMDKNLVAMDLLSLSTLRLMMYTQTTENEAEQEETAIEEPKIYILIEKTYVDLSIISNKTYMYSLVIRKHYEDLIDDDQIFENLVSKVNYFILAFYNRNPKAVAITHGIIHSRVEDNGEISKKLKESLEDINFEDFNIVEKVNIENISKESLKEIGLYYPVIGLSMKFFEKFNETLSLTEVKKKIGPIINRMELLISVGIFVGFIGIYLLIGFYIGTLTAKVDTKVSGIKNKMKSLATGEYLIRQKRLQSYKIKLDTFDYLIEMRSKQVPIFKDLVDFIPEDIMLENYKINEVSEISMAGKSEVKIHY